MCSHAGASEGARKCGCAQVRVERGEGERERLVTPLPLLVFVVANVKAQLRWHTPPWAGALAKYLLSISAGSRNVPQHMGQLAVARVVLMANTTLLMDG